MQIQDLEFHIKKFSDESWPVRRENALRLSNKIHKSRESFNAILKRLWYGVVSDDSNISYWSKRILSREVTLDFMYSMLEDTDILNDPQKSKHLFDIFNSKFLEFYPYILAHSDEFTDENKFYLVQLLASNGDHELIPFFTELSLSNDNRIKRESIKFLSNIKTKESMTGLISFVDDPNLEIKCSAAHGIKRIMSFMSIKNSNDSKEIILSLLPVELKNKFILCNSTDDDNSFLNFYSDLSSSQKLCFLLLTDFKPSLVKALIDQPVVEDRFFAFLIFGNFLDDDFNIELQNAIKSDFIEIRRIASKIMRETNILPEKNIILSLLDEKDEEILKSVFEMLSVNPIEDIFEGLYQKTLSISEDIRFFSLHPLASFFRFQALKEKIVNRLLECFKDRYWPIRNQASLCFKYIGEETITPLLDAINNDDPDISYWSIISLSQFNTSIIEERLIEFYNHISRLDLRLSTLKTLGNYNSDNVASLFKKEINDADCKSVVLKSMHNLDREKAQEIIDSCILKISEEELPFWMKLKTEN